MLPLTHILALIKKVASNYKTVELKSDVPALAVLAMVLLAGALYVGFVTPPQKFPLGSVVTVSEGKTLTDIANELKEQRVIRSPFFFRTLISIIADENLVIAGDYFFGTKKTIFVIAKRLTNGNYGLEPERITIPEGLTAAETAKLLAKRLRKLDARAFIKAAEGKEGYLFPDTYFFLPSIKAEEIVRVMERNFHTQVSELAPEIEEFGKPLHEVLTMASLIEEEARRYETRRRISGILWSRLNIDMPLQVDAVFLYINGKNTYELTLDDLDDSSPYNTYKYTGLPPGPITNPGLASIRAAINPEKTDYLFYLADRRGNTYYAETFDGHKRNRVLYLN
jgi:UPF0755 protein